RIADEQLARLRSLVSTNLWFARITRRSRHGRNPILIILQLAFQMAVALRLAHPVHPARWCGVVADDLRLLVCILCTRSRSEMNSGKKEEYANRRSESHADSLLL